MPSRLLADFFYSPTQTPAGSVGPTPRGSVADLPAIAVENQENTANQNRQGGNVEQEEEARAQNERVRLNFCLNCYKIF